MKKLSRNILIYIWLVSLVCHNVVSKLAHVTSASYRFPPITCQCYREIHFFSQAPFRSDLNKCPCNFFDYTTPEKRVSSMTKGSSHAIYNFVGFPSSDYHKAKLSLWLLNLGLQIYVVPCFLLILTNFFLIKCLNSIFF